MNREDIADKVLTDGYNCAAAVVLAYIDKHGLDRDFVLRITSAFGVGMGNTKETCGAATGGVILAGLLSENSDEAMSLSSIFLDEFEKSCGSTICRVIRGSENNGLALCSCEFAVKNAVKIIEENFI